MGFRACNMFVFTYEKHQDSDSSIFSYVAISELEGFMIVEKCVQQSSLMSSCRES